MTTWDFACSDPVDISIDNWTSGSIALAGEQTDTVVVEVLSSHRPTAAALLDQVDVEFEDGQLYIRGPRVGPFWRHSGLDLTIKAPAGSSCAAKTASADLTCVGTLSALSVHTASGDLSARTVTGAVNVRSASGDVLVDKAGGDLTIHTASGDTRVAQVDGSVRINSASGDATVGYCAGPVTIRTASGDMHLGAVVSGVVEVSSASGDVDVAVVPGLGVYLDLSSTTGEVRSELDAAGDEGGAGDEGAVGKPSVQIRVRTLSGDIQVRKSRNGHRDPVNATSADAG